MGSKTWQAFETTAVGTGEGAVRESLIGFLGGRILQRPWKASNWRTDQQGSVNEELAENEVDAANESISDETDPGIQAGQQVNLDKGGEPERALQLWRELDTETGNVREIGIIDCQAHCQAQAGQACTKVKGFVQAPLGCLVRFQGDL